MVTTLEQIKQKAIKEVEITGFETGDILIFQLKGISLTNLIQNGKIPNELLNVAIDMFEGRKKEASDKDKKENLPETIKMIDIVCDSAMVEPKFEDVKEYLTDTQKMEIFTFTQGGVEALKSFRQNKAVLELNSYINDVQDSTESDAKS